MGKQLWIVICLLTLLLIPSAGADDTAVVLHPDGTWERYESGNGLAENLLSLGYICEMGSMEKPVEHIADELPCMVPSLAEMQGEWEGENLHLFITADGQVLAVDTGETGILDQGRMVIGDHTWYLQKSLWPAEDFLAEELQGMNVMYVGGAGYVFFSDILYVYEQYNGEGIDRQLLYRTEGSGV